MSVYVGNLQQIWTSTSAADILTDVATNCGLVTWDVDRILFCHPYLMFRVSPSTDWAAVASAEWYGGRSRGQHQWWQRTTSEHQRNVEESLPKSQVSQQRQGRATGGEQDRGQEARPAHGQWHLTTVLLVVVLFGVNDVDCHHFLLFFYFGFQVWIRLSYSADVLWCFIRYTWIRHFPIIVV